MTAAQQPVIAAQQPEPPEGYLGTTARITSGPAPELVEAGYALEIADAPLLHRGLTLADLAHLVELVECGALTRDDAAPLCTVLLEWLDRPAAGFPVRSDVRRCVQQQGAGSRADPRPGRQRLRLGRTRREAGRIAFRLATRDKLLGLHADVAAFADEVAGQAAKHAATLWADHTYLRRPSRPRSVTTWWFRRTGPAAPGQDPGGIRPGGRLARRRWRGGRHPAADGQDAPGWVPGFRLRRSARPRRDVVGRRPGRRGHRGVPGVATIGQLACDLEIFASPAFGYVTLDASLCRASVLMPQKRNPYALPVLRGGAATLIGRLTGSSRPASPRPLGPTTGCTPMARWPARSTWRACSSGWHRGGSRADR